MAALAPPPSPPRIAQDDGDNLKRFNSRLLQVTAISGTVLGTGWLCTLGAIPAILGLMVAKHILVAVLVMGLGVAPPPEDEPDA
jgi:hypothetical protein